MIGLAQTIEARRSDLATPVELVAVSFAPSTAPRDWSVSVTIEDVGDPEAPRARNAGRGFREGGR